MLRKYRYPILGAVLFVGCCLTWAFTRSSADQGEANGNGKPATLPIAQVVLFNSGVGYFQREGEVNGDTHINLTFPTSDVNDLLKSLVLQDAAGGKIGAINYDSQDPIDKILRSFALDLNNNPTFGQILNQARGEKIEVMRQEKPGANPFKVTGTIIGMEIHQQAVEKGGTVEVEQLNLLAGEGMVGIPLSQVLSVHFANPLLESEFRRALQILAGAHDVQKKTVGLHFTGNGKRPVRVGYVIERPIWKTTYRLVLEPNGKLFMQGWAIVENTSDDDWNNVRMVLVSGKPISFRMDLYAPLYIPRPLVEPELFASLRPPVYDGSLGEGLANAARQPAQPGLAGAYVGGFNAGGKGMPNNGMQGMNMMGGGMGMQGMGMGGMGMMGGGMPSAGLPGFPGQPTGPMYGVPNGTFGGQGSNSVGNNYQQDAASNTLNLQLSNSANKLGYEEMMARKQQLARLADEAKRVGGSVAGMNFKEGIQSVATAEEVGEYYQYAIDQKISLPRQKSAMLPIVNQNIEGSKISIFNEAVHTKFPLLGIRLKNTSGKPLTQGPITVYDEGSYAGDTRTLDLQPNEERLLSYALDQSTEVKTATKSFPAPDMTLKIGGENLTAVYTMRQTKTYTLKNRGTHDRTVVVEHPIRADWKLVDPKKPKERTRDVYRFEIAVKSGETVTQEVVEEQTRTDPFALTVIKDLPPFYAIASGIEIKPQVTHSSTELLALKIVKGVLNVSMKQRESKTYYIQNQSDRDHTFTVDHIIRKEWKRLDKGGKDQIGPAVYEFKVAVASKKSALHEVSEEHISQDKSHVVGKLSEDALREFIANPAPTAKVKEALQQILDKQVKLRETEQILGDAKATLKLQSEDQVRVRENLKIIPQASETYKDFLKKFVAQEAQIDQTQLLIRTTEATLVRLQKEYDTYVSALTVE
jgi:hypothetical protein